MIKNILILNRSALIGLGSLLNLTFSGCVAVYDHAHLNSEDPINNLDGGDLTVSADPSGGGANTHPPWALVFSLVMNDDSAKVLEVSDIKVNIGANIYTFNGPLVARISDSGFAQVITSSFIPKLPAAANEVSVSYKAKIIGRKNQYVSKTVKFIQRSSRGVGIINPLLDVS